MANSCPAMESMTAVMSSVFFDTAATAAWARSGSPRSRARIRLIVNTAWWDSSVSSRNCVPAG